MGRFGGVERGWQCHAQLKRLFLLVVPFVQFFPDLFDHGTGGGVVVVVVVDQGRSGGFYGARQSIILKSGRRGHGRIRGARGRMIDCLVRGARGGSGANV